MRKSELTSLLRKKVFVMTGAGISAASGIPTFRGSDGLYEGLNPYDLATPQAFRSHPVTVWNWYLMRIHQGKDAQPNAAHDALAELEGLAEALTIVTSNVDPLHERAGSHHVYHLHGNILEFRCTGCDVVRPLDPAVLPQRVDEETLFRCGCGALLRPNVVWFGERPWPEAVEVAIRELCRADVVLEVGQSGIVAYGFTDAAVSAGIPVVRVNPDGQREGGVLLMKEPAEVALPRLVASVRRAAGR